MPRRQKTVEVGQPAKRRWHQRMVRHGWAVEISREDKSTFLAACGRGILPAVFGDRKYAMAYKQELIEHKFTCRVVPITFTYPMPNDGDQP